LRIATGACFLECIHASTIVAKGAASFSNFFEKKLRGSRGSGVRGHESVQFGILLLAPGPSPLVPRLWFAANWVDWSEWLLDMMGGDGGFPMNGIGRIVVVGRKSLR
jgi:hypothetical protein